MDALSPALSALCDKALGGVVNWLQQNVNYLFNYEDHVNKLKAKIKDLDDARDKVQHRVVDEENNGREIEVQVKTWLEKVNSRIEKHKEDFANKANTRCYNGLFPDPWSRYTLGKQACQMADEVDAELKAQPDLAYLSRQKPISMQSTLSNIDYESFDTRKEAIDGVNKKLKDSSVRMIGIYGPGGVGKTTLVKNIAGEVQDKFKLVMASVTRNPDRKKIQGEIADFLGLRLDEESENGRAERIRERLKTETKNTLIILDDLWDRLDLNGLGIPIADDGFSNKMNKTDNKGKAEEGKAEGMTVKKEKSLTDQGMIKILLTSRSKVVLSTQMGVDENLIFPIGVLEKKEAETLFKKVAKVTDQSLDIEPLMAKISKKCEGLPIAIITIGKALEGKSQHEWDDAVQQLERKGFTGMSESLEFSTWLSFNSLENEDLKSAFLLCAQLGNDLLTVDLMKYCYGLSVMQGVYTIKEARDRTLTLIRKLKDLSLLMDDASSDHLNMHDMVRDAALSISAKERHVFCRRDEKLDEWPDKDELERFSSISLCNCYISDDLPEDITFPKLQFFHINNRHPFVKIPNNFNGVKKLKVLILTDIPLPHLPFSNGSIANSLRMLCLERCLLSDTKNLSIVGELKKLRILSFSGSCIEKLPSELGKLSNLQWLDISNCSQLQVIPPNVLSRLDSLEELYLRDSPIQWGSEGQQNCEIRNATLVELSHLHQLTNLDVSIPDATVFPRNLFLDILDRYNIVIGDPTLLSMEDFMMPKKYEASRALVLQLKEGLDIHTYMGIKMLLRRVEKLFLGELHGIGNVFYDLNLEGFQYLKHFCIQNNGNIECIIDSKMSCPQDAFPNLESLCLDNLKNLKTICRIKLTDSSFGKLKSIKIKDCAQLKNIFPISMARLLKMLETLEVSNCDSLKEIVVGEEDTNNKGEVVSKIEFLQFRSLKLQSLPAFTSFYTDGFNTSPSIIFNEQVEIPELVTLELSLINDQIQKIWNGQTPPSSCLKNLVKLNVDGCDGLTYLISILEAKNLENLKTISVSNCDEMENILKPEEINSIDEKVCIFPKLEEINLTSMVSLSTIWHPQEAMVDFPTLSSVSIEKCENLVTVFPHHMVGCFPRLERLNISECSSIKEIFCFKKASQNNSVGNETNLRFVYIDSLPNLKDIWNQDPKGILSFKNIQSIQVLNCDNLENLFPPSFANGLEKLDYLQIIGCPKLHGIAYNKGHETRNICFKFPKLTFVEFGELPELESFYQGRHTLEWPSLKKLEVFFCDKLEVFPIPIETKNQDNQPFFLPEKVISNLEFMDLSQKEAERLHHYVESHLLLRLKELHFYKLQSIAILFKILHRIPNLEKLLLLNCLMKELLPSGSLVAYEKIGTVIQIKDLTLKWMPLLENIGFEHDPVLQRVECLFLSSCASLISLAPSTVSFTHLKSLEVKRCNKLLNLVRTSTAKSLVKLTTMKVTECGAIEEIVAKERNQEERVDMDEIVFKKLTTLELVSLKNLTSFCNCKNHNLIFPVLEKLIVRECLRMKTFSEGVTTAPVLQQLSLAYAKEDEEKWLWERDLNSITRNIFTDMVFLKHIEYLELSQYSELERVWYGRVPLLDNYFRNLKTLEVSNCGFLSSVIPFCLLAYLKNLKELQVSYCNLVEVIFDMNDTKMTKIEGKTFRLESLSLNDLPNLKHVWNKDPQELISFYNLQDMSVSDCKRLRTLFPKSVAKNLLKLEKLDIRICQALEEVAGKEVAAADGAIDEMFEFPRLAKLWLFRLPELKCFYPGRFKLKCPILKDLFVYHCGKLEIFKPEYQGYEEFVSQDQIIAMEARSFFSIKEVIPTLREVTLNEKDIKMLWLGGFQETLCNIKWLQLQCFHNINEMDRLPFQILQKIPNVETLVVRCSGLKEIFFSQKLEDYHLTMLKQLELWDLPRLNSIGSKHCAIDSVLENLEVLEVHECHCLTELIQSSVSFSNLKEMKISQCDGLLYLFTSSTVKRLVQLEKIDIEGCESIEVVVTEDKDESDSPNEIIFEKLRWLWLESLSNLASFYSGSSILKFPCLNDVDIEKCPRMKTFSNGIMETPLLCGQMTISVDNLPAVDDLKSTVNKMFNDKLYWAGMGDLKLSNYPELKELWLGETPLPPKCFSELRTLVVENCEFLSDVIPSNLLPCLKNLEELRVRNCSSVQVIFDIHGTKTSETEEQAFLLKKLTLEQLPNLKLVWNKNPQRIMSFEKLQKVKVSDCESLRYLFPAASMVKHILKLKVQNCGALAEILGKENTASGISETFEFPYLTTVILNHLPELNCFYPGKLNLKCPMLKVLNVYHCGKLEMFTSEAKCYQALSEDQVGVSVNAPLVFWVEEVTPKLEEVSLNKKETMTLWHQEFQANFLHNIKCLQLYCFHSVTDQEDTLPYGFLHKVSNIEILAVACSDFKDIFPSRGLKDEYIRMLAKLKGLRLEALPKLNSIGLEHSWLVSLDENLETLEIRRCSALTNIVQSAVSFSNLKELTVVKCHKMVYLFTSSTAKSLVQIRKMSIEKCESMREIVAKEEKESTEDEIVFGELTKLSLNNLSNLGSFYTGNSTLSFPYLQEVIIAQCPKMKVFSEGSISAPQLPAIKVSLEKRDVRWEGDLNSTVKKILKGKEVIIYP